MLGKVKLAAAGALVATMCAGSALAAEGIELPSQSWSFKGVFGTFDRAALQRGFQIYQEVCAGCHSIRLVAYRNLSALGYNEDEIKAIAAEASVVDGPDADGEMFDRPGKPSDRFVSPFPNDRAAAASNNNAIPPDLTLITKARKSGHDYMYGLMTGYEDEAPEGIEIGEGQYYNAYFPGHAISMPPPLSDGAVEYTDGTPATLDQMSHDITTFLAWTAQPELEERKRMGVKVILFLIVLTAMLYAVKRKVWADLH